LDLTLKNFIENIILKNYISNIMTQGANKITEDFERLVVEYIKAKYKIHSK